jgi:hypothetical protein
LISRILSGGYILVLIGLATLAAAPGPAASDAYLARQAAALRPAFRADLEALADAPRYTIEASVDPELGSVAGVMQLDYINSSGEMLTDLVFRLLPNAESIYGGGSLSVTSAAAAGAPLESEPSEDGTVLWVQLEHPLAPGESLSLELTFSAQVPERTSQGYGIFNRALGALTLAGWYPLLAIHGEDGWDTPPVPATGDAMFAETSFYEVRLTTPAGYQVVSTGSVVGQEEGPAGVTWHLVSGPVREFAIAISDRFEVREAQSGEVTLRLHTLPAEEPAVAPDAGLEMLDETFAVYVERFGPYPFVEFDLVEAVVPIDGYEFSGMAYLDYAKRTRETAEDYRYSLAHEVAHQWWYGLVGNHSVREPWLDESLASYAALVALEVSVSSEAGEALLADWKETAGRRGPGDPPVNSSTLAFATWDPYHATVYTRGALFLDELRAELGDDGAFFALLKRYQAAYRYQMATTADFLSLAEELAGWDLDPLFAIWFDLDVAGPAGEHEATPPPPPPQARPFSSNPRVPGRKGGPFE